MQDRVPLYPGRVVLTPVSGQANTYDMTRADQPTQEGTPLNKASLLKDATAALFDLGSDAVPDDMLNALAHTGDLHVWKRTQNGQVDYPVSPNPNAYQEGTSGNITIEYAGQLGGKARIEVGSYVGTGTSGEANPNVIQTDAQARIVYIFADNVSNNTTDLGIFIRGMARGFRWTGPRTSEGTASSGAYSRPTFSDTEISWYSTNNPITQFNTNGTTYNYVIVS